MEELKNILKQSLTIDFISAILSNPRTKDGITKVKVRGIKKKEELIFQFEEYKNNQAFHKNLTAEEAISYIEELLQEFKQMQIETRQMTCQVLVSKKGKMTIKKKMQKGCVKEVDHSHNRSKNYILEVGKAVPFLQDLGVMTQSGEIVRTKFDKFRQINRFL